MKYLLGALAHPRHIERAKEHVRFCAEKSTEELVEQYNKSVELGIVGSAEQALRLGAMRAELIKRMGQSPIVLEDGMILSLTQPVTLEDGVLHYLDGSEVGDGKSQSE